MKKFFVIAIMYCVNICVGQDNKLNLVDIIDALNVGTLHYLDSAPDKARSSESMRQHFKDYINAGYKDADYGNKPNKELILSKNRQDFSLLEKNKIKIDSLLMNSTVMGSMSGEFHFSTRLPLRFADNNGKLTFLITGILSDKVYNTFSTTPKKRATSALQDIILPYINRTSPIFSIKGLGFVAYQISYPCKDFTVNGGDYKRWECLAIVIPVELLKKFIKLKVSEDELVAKSEIYLQDRSSTELKKILIALE